jgi:AbrB family looped-hinge helix DNA binding protein
MAAVYVSDKGQVTLPAQIRRKLGIKPKSKMDIEVRDNEIVLRPVKSIMDVYGIFSEAAQGKTDDWETIRRKTMEAVVKQVIDEDKR